MCVWGGGGGGEGEMGSIGDEGELCSVYVYNKRCLFNKQGKEEKNYESCDTILLYVQCRVMSYDITAIIYTVSHDVL